MPLPLRVTHACLVRLVMVTPAVLMTSGTATTWPRREADVGSGDSWRHRAASGKKSHGGRGVHTYSTVDRTGGRRRTASIISVRCRLPPNAVQIACRRNRCRQSFML